MQHLQKIIKEQFKNIFLEVLDYNPTLVSKKVDTKIFDMPQEPISVVKTVDIDGHTIRFSFLINKFEKSVHVSFNDASGSFDSITNTNIIGRIFSNAFHYFKQFIEWLNSKLYKENQKGEIKITFSINTIIFTPSKIKDVESNLSAEETKRGRLYKYFVEKAIKGANIDFDDEDIYVDLNLPIKLGISPKIEFKF